MMYRALGSSTVVLAFSLFAIAAAPAEDALPKGQPPAMVTARLGSVGNLTITRVVLVPEQRTTVEKRTITEFRTEIIAGRTVTKAVAVEKEVPVVTTSYAEVTQESDFAKSSFQVRDLDGKKLEGEALTQAFAKARPVLLVSGAKELDPFYAAFFKPGTLVVFLDEPSDKTPRAVPLPALGGPKLPLPEIRAVPAVPVEIKAVPLPAVPAVPAPPAPPK